ncbi:hypothetical protein C477_20739 [Haloterrigena salina JCM 13891]|uniref:Uncharacterized protein n=1 Tax=Haloterrigena salina JCM 13891 TaxID=1227488 RepID=M0BUI1_9EURY|nr:hypothetical protein C477_20739 [Haloterrigena salina JCM 13891]
MAGGAEANARRTTRTTIPCSGRVDVHVSNQVNGERAQTHPCAAALGATPAGDGGESELEQRRDEQ